MELSYEAWCSLSDQELAQRDIAEANLFAAYNLPNAGFLDFSALQKRLDDWADMADYGVRRSWKRRVRGEASNLTGNQFRVMVMVTVLQRNLGVKYNWDFSQGEYDATDARNLFLHGPLTGHGGTCVTMPVLYAAIGRRLGFPIKLVLAKQHTFCRWDDGNGEQFNIEATSPGFNSRPDEHYLRWPIPISPQEVERREFLANLSPREELAFFINQRGMCWFDNLKTLWAVEAHHYAHLLAPANLGYHNDWGVSILLHRLVEHLRRQRIANPHATAIPSIDPRDEWERRALPVVEEHLERIIRNRIARKNKSERDAAIKELVTQPAPIM